MPHGTLGPRARPGAGSRSQATPRFIGVPCTYESSAHRSAHG
ncbi:hypothetical protein FM112_16310 [Gulosibacter sp. 10]|nr:hypothetical protein FM112_16310 [Gulosibacter sp. 10]